MQYEDYAIEARDYQRIEKLNRLTDVDTFWDDVRELTMYITSHHSIKRWECLADVRFREIGGR